MQNLTHKDFEKMFHLAIEKVVQKEEEINKINVFPVPDQDTGTNLKKTLFGIKKSIENKEFRDLKEFGEKVLEGALFGAQGNIGVIFTGFLAGFLPTLGENPSNAKILAKAFEEGKKKAESSILEPKEGTVLDVISAAAQTFIRESQDETNILEILRRAIKKAKEALLATKEKMEVLKKANVVDAGGLGFLVILEAFLEALEGEREEVERPISEKIREILYFLPSRYELVALIKNPRINEKEIREKLKNLGDSLDIVQIKNFLKIHIHTDQIDEVQTMVKGFGQVKELRVEDISKEVIGEPSVRKVSVGIVTENLASLLPKIIEKYQIEIAETKFDWLELEKIDEIGIETKPKTNQVMSKDYLEAFKKQLQKFDKVLCLTSSSKLSGSYNFAIQASEMLPEKERERIFVFDTLHAAASQALFVLKAIEMIQEQREIEEIIEKFKDLIPKTHLYLTFTPSKGIRSIGRITKSQANRTKRVKKLGIYPIMELKNGILRKRGMVFAKDEAEALFKKAKKESKKMKIRTVINHVDNLDGAKRLKELLKEIGTEVSFISESPSILCKATGPGTLILGWQPLE